MLQMDQEKEKVHEVHMFKTLAFLAVVMQSSLSFSLGLKSGALEQSVLMGLLYNLVKFSAPVFIFVVGFHAAQLSRKTVQYHLYLADKWKEIIVPYILWSAVYLLFFPAVNMFGIESVSAILKSMVFGTAAPHLWYVVMVFQFHLLIPLFLLIFHWLKGHLHSAKFLAVMAFLVTGIHLGLVWASSKYVFNGVFLTEHLFLRFTDRSFIAYTFYFILGGTAALTIDRWRKFVRKSLILNMYIFLGMFLVVGYELLSFHGIGSIDLQVSTYLKPTMFIYIISEMLLLYGISMVIVQARSFLFHLLNFIGNHTFPSYLGHFFFLQIIASVIPVRIFAGNHLLLAILLFCLTTCASVVFSFLVSEILNRKSLLSLFGKRKGKGVMVGK